MDRAKSAQQQCPSGNSGCFVAPCAVIPQEPTRRRLSTQQASLGIIIDQEIRRSVPSRLVSTLSVPLVSFVDCVVAGHLASTNALIAVAVGASGFSVACGLFVFLFRGTVQSTARACNITMVHEAAVRGVIFGLVIGGALIAWRESLVGLLLQWLFPPREAWAETRSYCFARLWGAPFVLASYALQGVLDGMEQMQRLLHQQVVVGVTNAVLCVALAFPPADLGLVGVGYAASAADLVGFAGGLIALRAAVDESFSTCVDGVRVYRGSCAWSRTLLQVFALGPMVTLLGSSVMSTVRGLCLNMSAALFTAFAARITTAARPTLAANMLLLQLHSLTAGFAGGFGRAAEGLVGESIKDGDKPRLHVVIRRTVRMGILLALSGSALILVVGRPLLSLMVESRSIWEEAERYLSWVAAGPLIFVWVILIEGLFVGAALTMEMLLSTLFASSSYVLTVAVVVGTSRSQVTAASADQLWFCFYAFMGYRLLGLLVFSRRLEARVHDGSNHHKALLLQKTSQDLDDMQ